MGYENARWRRDNLLKKIAECLDYAVGPTLTLDDLSKEFPDLDDGYELLSRRRAKLAGFHHDHERWLPMADESNDLTTLFNQGLLHVHYEHHPNGENGHRVACWAVTPEGQERVYRLKTGWLRRLWQTEPAGLIALLLSLAGIVISVCK